MKIVAAALVVSGLALGSLVACESKGATFYFELKGADFHTAPYCMNGLTKSDCVGSDCRFAPGVTCASEGYKVCPGGKEYRQFKDCSDPRAK